MKRLRARYRTSILLISHDLGVIADVADRVIVMYCGRVVETAEIDDLFDRPAHPYTEGLLNSIPSRSIGQDRLYQIPGAPPAPTERGARLRLLSPLPEADARSAWNSRHRCSRSARPSRPPALHCRQHAHDGSPAGRRAGEGLCGEEPLERVRRGEIGRAGRRRSVGRDCRVRNPGAGGRVRLRQVDDRPPDHAPDRAFRGSRRVRGQGHHRRFGRRVAPGAPAHADGVSGPAKLAQSAAHHPADRRRTARRQRPDPFAGAPPRGRRAVARQRWPFAVRAWAAIPISSPAARGSASASRARSRSVPASSWPTSRYRRSMSRSRRRSSISCRICRRRGGSPTCSYRTISPSCVTSPTVWR